MDQYVRFGLGCRNWKGVVEGGGVSICAVYLITHDLLHVPKGGGGAPKKDLENPEKPVQPPPPPPTGGGGKNPLF